MAPCLRRARLSVEAARAADPPPVAPFDPSQRSHASIRGSCLLARSFGLRGERGRGYPQVSVLPPRDLHAKEEIVRSALPGLYVECFPAVTACDWRTHWRTKHKLPANRLFQGGLGPRPVIHEEAGLCQGHGLREVGRFAVGGGSGCGGDAPVIHPAARGGPECRAGLGGSIKWAAVLFKRGQTNMRARPSSVEGWSGARGAFKWSTGAHGAVLTGRARAGPGA